MPTYIKPATFLGILAGLGLGFLLALPVIQLFIIFLFLGIGGFAILVLKQNNFLQNFSQKDGAIIGGISGLTAVFAAAVTFIPFSLLIGAIFKTNGLIFSFFTSPSSFVVFIMLLICLAIMNMAFNIGTALLVISVLESLQHKTQQETIKINQEKTL